MLVFLTVFIKKLLENFEEQNGSVNKIKKVCFYNSVCTFHKHT